MSGDKLLPCPFCGGEATVSSERCGWRVDCLERGCYTRGPWPDDGTEAEAIDAWNTRTNTTTELEADVSLWKREAADRSEKMIALNLDRAAMGVENMQLRETLEWYADQMCEGWCDKDPRACEAIGPENCAGCPARQALHDRALGK